MKNMLIAAIRFYQRFISPHKGMSCPYIPSCSNYGLESIVKYGAFFGIGLTAWRILRCNPFSKGGVDYVPDEIFKGKIKAKIPAGGNKKIIYESRQRQEDK